MLAMKAILSPSGDQAASSTSYSPSVSCFALPPLALTVKRWVYLPSKNPLPSPLYLILRMILTSLSSVAFSPLKTLERKRMVLPSGDQAGPWTPSSTEVTCLASPPSVGITNIWFFFFFFFFSSSFFSPSARRFERKRMLLPSGDHLGELSLFALDVNCLGLLSFSGSSQMWVSYLSSSMFAVEYVNSTFAPSGDTWGSETGAIGNNGMIL